MNFIVVIPARLNSTRLKKKLLLEINNKPLFIHTAQQASKSLATEIFIATDSIEIKKIAESYDFKSVMTSENHSSGTDRINEFLNVNEINDSQVLVNVQGDEPLVDENLINNLAQTISLGNSFASAYKSFKSFDEYSNPNNVKVLLNHNNMAITFSRSLLGNLNKENFCDDLAYHHLGIYAYSAKQVREFCMLDQPKIEQTEKLEQLRAIYNNIQIAMVKHTGKEMIGVDTADDFDQIKKFLK